MHIGSLLRLGQASGLLNRDLAVTVGVCCRVIKGSRQVVSKDSADDGQVILGNKPRRVTAKERVVLIASGMAVFDVAWGYELYKSALERGLGQRLLLWDEPYRE